MPLNPFENVVRIRDRAHLTATGRYIKPAVVTIWIVGNPNLANGTFFTITSSVSIDNIFVTPEPSAILLLGLSLGGLVFAGRRQKA